MLIIGLTKSDPEDNYSSYMDGYQPGRAQDTIHLPDPSNGDYDLEEIAEAVFVAMNAPDGLEGLSEKIRAILDKAEIRTRSLSVGDTITVEGLGMVACDKTGWSWVGMHGD